MDNKNLVLNRSKRKRILLLLVVVLMLLVVIVFPKISSLNTFAWDLVDSYFTIIEQIADRILLFTDSESSIQEHQVWVGTEFVAQLDNKYLLKKWTLILFVLIWVTPTKVFDKLAFTGLLLLGNFVGSLVNIGLTAHILSLIPNPEAVPYIGRTPFVLLMLSLLATWIWRKREGIMNSSIVKKLNLAFIKAKLPSIFIVLIIWALLGNLFQGLFEYTPWINFLFNITAWILNILKYPASVESHFLVGENGTMYLAKACLGFNTMLLYAGVVYITGTNGIKKWLFILGGLILLNISNIARFVLLFIHIQKHGGYALEIDIHDMYNYVIYTIVFILWIIWFETYSYLKVPPSSSKK